MKDNGEGTLNTFIKIAEVAHEVNRAYCRSIGDHSQAEWSVSPQWQKASAINGVHFTMENPDATPRNSHENWLSVKLKEGWKYGEVKDPDKKEHPCCVPYDELPREQKVKDDLYQTVVKTMLRQAGKII